jgi:hypothetical protein
MINETLLLDILLNNQANLEGNMIAIEGTLRVIGDSIFVDIDTGDCKVSVSVTDSTLFGRLLDEAPCYLGGEFLFNDPVKLIGLLERKENELLISSVASGVLYRDNESFPF